MEGRLASSIEHGFLLIVFISSINCLSRADFNFIFGLVSYYLWHKLQIKGEDHDLARKIITLNLILLVLDLVYIVSLTSVWGDDTDIYIKMHNFVIMLSWINFFIRVI
jgi:hypothetical protein